MDLYPCFRMCVGISETMDLYVCEIMDMYVCEIMDMYVWL
jgi:hypothetical protein